MTADDIKALVERYGETMATAGYEEGTDFAASTRAKAEDMLGEINAALETLNAQSFDHESAIGALQAENQRLRVDAELMRQELKNIANADTVEWDDPTQYEAWAKSRARHTLAQIDKEKP